MPIKKWLIACCLGILPGCMACYAQSVDSVTDKVVSFPSRLLGRIQRKTADLDQQLTRQTEQYVSKMARSEARLKKKLARLDSADASGTKGGAAGSAVLFAGHPELRYAALLQKLRSDSAAAAKVLHGEYIPYADSLQGMLRYLNANPQILAKAPPAEVVSALNQVRQLQARMQDAGEMQQFMQQRQTQLKQFLSQYTNLPSSITNEYNGYNKQLYYYSEQVKAYKEALNDPDKLLKLALTILDKVPAFTNFMKSNSVLAGIFNLPGTYDPSLSGQGLASRDQVLAAFQNQAGAGGPNLSSLVQQNMQSAQGQVDQLRSKLSSYGSGGNADIDIPDFRPNAQKTRSFLHRLEYGVNMQTVSSTNFFPATTDLGLSIGYKLNDKNVIGVGASYKIGWGKDFNHISMSSQGASLRSYLDINIKKSWFASGGFEYNYQQPFDHLHFPRLDSWQQSGLLGISKIISLKTKVFKKTKIQFLWDFLSYQQVPVAQPFKFRIGYNF
jgi:hypothetical protein